MISWLVMTKTANDRRGGIAARRHGVMALYGTRPLPRTGTRRVGGKGMSAVWWISRSLATARRGGERRATKASRHSVKGGNGAVYAWRQCVIAPHCQWRDRG